jgi:hypothetical protein
MLGCVVPEVQYYKREEYVETPQVFPCIIFKARKLCWLRTVA